MAKKTRLITLQVGDIKTNFFVRKHLNEDHVVTLADLYDHGVSLPPLQVSDDQVGGYQLIDGRHRLEALKLIDRKEVECVLVETQGFADAVSHALEANVGGSLPPTRDDIEHTMKLLIEGGVPRIKIYDLMPFPKGLIRRYLDVVQSELAKARMVRAVDAVASKGYTVAQAAHEFDIDLDALKLRLSGKKKSAAKDNLKNIKSAIGSRMRGLSQTNIGVIRKLFQQYEDGDMSSAQVLDVFEQLMRSMRRATRVVEDWSARFNASIVDPSRKLQAGTRATPEERGGTIRVQ